MKIIKNDSRQLVVETKRGFNPILLIWGFFFGGIPLFIFVLFFAGLGVININCERVEINQVNCQVRQTKFLGLQTKNVQQFNNLVTAEFKQIKGVDSDGQKTLDNKIILNNKYEEKFLVEDAMFINGIKGDEKKLRLITSEIQNFLNSDNIYLTVNYDNRWRWANLIIFLFLSIFIVIGCSVIIFNIISIGYEKYNFNKSGYKLNFEKVNLLGKKNETHSLKQINSIIIQVDKDSDGDKVYSLIVPIGNKKQYELDRNYKINITQTNADEIANFLNVKVITKINF